MPVEERELEAELEERWYTLEEEAREGMMKQGDGQQSPMYEESKGGDAANSASTNPFRMLNKKDKDHQQVVGSNLDVKRVKYSFKQTSPSGDVKSSPEQESFTTKEANARVANSTTSPFQPPAASGKEGLRSGKGGRRAGPQTERAR